MNEAILVCYIKPIPACEFKNGSRVCISLCTTVVHNPAQNSSDYFPS